MTTTINVEITEIECKALLKNEADILAEFLLDGNDNMIKYMLKSMKAKQKAWKAGKPIALDSTECLMLSIAHDKEGNEGQAAYWMALRDGLSAARKAKRQAKAAE